MVDIQALKKDLEKLKPSIQKAIKESLIEQKLLCDKINNREFDGVIHAMFTRDEIIKFLKDNSIPNNIVRKTVLEKDVEKSLEHFKGALLNKIKSLIVVKEVVDIFEKHGVHFDADNGSPISGVSPEIIELFNSTMANTTVSIINGKKFMMEITHHESGVPSPIIAVIDANEFYKDWAAEHFLVKDVSAATFELVY